MLVRELHGEPIALYRFGSSVTGDLRPVSDPDYAVLTGRSTRPSASTSRKIWRARAEYGGDERSLDIVEVIVVERLDDFRAFARAALSAAGRAP